MVRTEVRTGTASPKIGLVDILRRRAEHTPDDVVYEFVGLHQPVGTLTYRELADRALRVARRLIGPDGDPQQEPALLLCPPGLDYVVALFACLIAGVPAVPAYPPDPLGSRSGLARLHRLIADATPTAVLMEQSLAPIFRAGPWPTACPPRMIALDQEEESSAGHAEWPATPAGDKIAVIQYTSGSTRSPRGVVVLHGNLEHNIVAIEKAFALGPGSRAVSWLPPYHDMGLVGGILTPLHGGFPIRLMSPFDFLKQPLYWLRHISEMHATASGGPNFAYDLCVRRALDDKELLELDLSAWSVAFNGAEPVRWRTLNAFADKFAPAGFRRKAFFPCYGLAEATLIVSGGHWDGTLFRGTERASAGDWGPAASAGRPDEVPRVGCGCALGDQDLAIVDPDSGSRLADGKEGEIWIRGPGVTTGYWRCDDQAAFGELGGNRYLRTGDLGFLVDGELVISGRRKDLIIYRGVNFHPADIEEHAAMAPGLRPVAAAFAVDDESGALVVVAVEARPGSGEPVSLAADVRSRIAAATGLAPHVIVIAPPGAIPRTSSGKVQRWLCREMFLSGELDALVTVRAERSMNGGDGVFGDAESLTTLICGVFAAACSAPSCMPHTTLFELGGDSLKAAEIASVLEGALATPVAVDVVLAAQTSSARVCSTGPTEGSSPGSRARRLRRTARAGREHGSRRAATRTGCAQARMPSWDSARPICPTGRFVCREGRDSPCLSPRRQPLAIVVGSRVRND
jgi:acyl-CoA synthetase (AMP-forming)/AMP-acid ligase II